MWKLSKLDSNWHSQNTKQKLIQGRNNGYPVMAKGIFKNKWKIHATDFRFQFPFNHLIQQITPS